MRPIFQSTEITIHRHLSGNFVSWSFTEHEITQLGCIDMVKINGVFHYKATSDEDTSCAVFFIGEIDEILTLTISKLSLSKSDDTEEYIKVQFRSAEVPE